MFVKNQGKVLGDVLGEMLVTAKEIKAECRDMITPAPTFAHNGEEFVMGIDGEEFLPTNRAMSQFLIHLGASNKVKPRLASKTPWEKALGDYEVQELLAHNESPFFMRTYQDKVRAALTPNYSVFDAPSVLEVMEGVLNHNGVFGTYEMNVPQYLTDSEFTQIRLHDTQVVNMTDKGVFCGLKVSTSDVGAGRFNIRFFVYRKACMNGLCIPLFDKVLFAHRHIGITAEDIAEGLRHSFHEFPYLADQARDILVRAEEQKLVKNIWDKGGQREALKKAFAGIISDKMLNNVMEISVKYPNTVWGLTNAFTEYARDQKDFEVRNRIEEMAGHLIVNPRRYGIVA